MTHEERVALKPGDRVLVESDHGTRYEYEVKAAPWQLGHGAWVVGLRGITGGYDLGRVVARVDASEVAVLTEQLEVACDRAQSWKNLHDRVRADGERVRAAADEMLAELLGDFANGVANGYFPEVGAKLDRWCDALGRPRVKRYGRDGVAD